MTSKHSDNEYDSSRGGQSSPPGPNSGYDAYSTVADHHTSGQGENGYNVDANDTTNSSQNMNSSQTGYSQGSSVGGGAGGSSSSDYGARLGGSSGTSTGSKPDDERKLFVGGLTWDTNQEDLREYFSTFGGVVDCSIKHDAATGRSRGFAFLVFDSKDVVEKILAQNDHFVKGRKVDPKPAHRRLAGTTATNQMNNSTSLSSSAMYGSLGQQSAMSYGGSMGVVSVNPYSNNRKVFIGGLDPSFPDAQLREYFSQFGKIDEIDLPYDKEKNERRPFCFISFESEQAAQEVLRLQRHTIGDITVDVKRAKPKTLNNQQQQQQQMYDPYGQQQPNYATYGTGTPSYGGGSYSTADPYAAWSAYTYSQQPNAAAAAAAAYQYGSSGSTSAPSPVASSYSQYPQHQSSAQYQYAPSSTTSASDYYSHYGYGAQQPTGSVYGDPNAYGGGYDYASYYASAGAGVGGSVGDNGAVQQQGGSPGNPADYEHDNHYGKAKTSIVASPTYHPYSRN